MTVSQQGDTSKSRNNSFKQENASTKRRSLDVLVWGASGFTGKLVCEYLLNQYGVQGDLRWAIAGRNRAKLEALRDQLGIKASALPIFMGECDKEKTLRKLASSTRVIITTVGPYALYGSKLVGACVEEGTHYCDLSGEVSWMKYIIDQYHERARATGACIVHSCGFDSMPMDLGVWWLQNAIKEKHGIYASSITMLVEATKGGASGGTISSAFNALVDALNNKKSSDILANPYSLNPVQKNVEEHNQARALPPSPDQRGVKYNEIAKQWTAPFVMAGINTRNVRRSHALAGHPYGLSFEYHEALMTGSGISGAIKGFLVTLGLGAFVLAACTSFTRWLLLRFFLPAPGQGPTRKAREAGFFRLGFFASVPNRSSQSPQNTQQQVPIVVRAHVAANSDPGYGSTSKMLAEAGVCLAQDQLTCGGGVHTPSSAMAGALLRRLQTRAELIFELKDSPKPPDIA